MSTRSTSILKAALVTLCLLGVLIGVLATPAFAGKYANEAVAGLQHKRVFIDPSVRDTLVASTAASLENQVNHASSPIYVAVLPGAALAEGGGRPDGLARAIQDGLHRPGTVLVLSGGQLGASSTSKVGSNAASGAVSAALRGVGAKTGKSLGKNAARALTDATSRTVTNIRDAAKNAAKATPNGAAGGPSIWRSPLARLLLLVVLTVAVIILLDLLLVQLTSRQRRQTSSHEFEDVRVLANEDIMALGDDLRGLEIGLDADNDNPMAVRDNQYAHESLQQGIDAYERARTPEELAPVSTALEAGRYLMTRARARFEGSELPRRRPPCFFDTRHGPSVDDVGWMPDNGPARPVPACEDCMKIVAGGAEPQPRTVVSNGKRMPFYDAPPHFESWFGGYFGGAAADLVQGFALGRALDDGFVGGLNTFGGGYGYVPASFAETGVLDAGGAFTGGLAGVRGEGELLTRPAGHDADND